MTDRHPQPPTGRTRSPSPGSGPDPAAPDGAGPVPELLDEVFRRVAVLAHRARDECGLHPTDLTALRVLARGEGRLTVSQLGACLRLSSAAVTGLVDRLAGAGLVLRVRDEADRRRVFVVPTPLADEVRDRVLREVAIRVDGALAALRPTDLAAVERFLRLVLADSG